MLPPRTVRHTPALTGALILCAATLSPPIQAVEGVRVLLAATIETTLSSRINADILRLDVRPGDRFKKGAVLVAFDCRLPRAELAKARAELEAARRTLGANQNLAKYKAVSELEVAMAEAQVAKGRAEVALYEAQVSLCEVAAPFDGRVVALRTAPFAGVSAGAPLLDILDTSALEVQLHYPSEWLARIAPGAQFRVRIDETGREYAAEVLRIGARVDPVSRTIDVAGRILEPDDTLLAGMSGTASFDQP